MVTFVYMGRFVNNLHCREDFWQEESYREEFLSSLPLEAIWEKLHIAFSKRPALLGRQKLFPKARFLKTFPL